MILIKDIPMVSLQKALFKLIKEKQDKPIYGSVPTDAAGFYITIGGITAKPTPVKDVTIWNMSVTFDVWGSPDDKEAVNESVNDISTLITYYGMSLQIENYEVIDVDIDLAETFPAADNGYHGNLTAIFKMNKTN